jgi:hypothetical protein
MGCLVGQACPEPVEVAWAMTLSGAARTAAAPTANKVRKVFGFMVFPEKCFARSIQ